MMNHGKTTQTGKINTAIEIVSNDTLKNGDQITFVLKDAQGKPIVNKHINMG